MRKNPVVALLVAVVLMLAVVAPVMAFEPIDNLIVSGKMSNDEVYTVYIDLLSSQQGTVTSTVYKTNAETPTLQNHAVAPQPYSGLNGSKDKLSRFFLFLSHNNTDHVMGLKGGTPDELVAGYVYGERKSDVINTYINGIVDCLGNPALWTGGGSGISGSTKTDSPKKPETVNKSPDSWAEKYITTTFAINTTTYSVLTNTKDTAETVSPEVRTMDVAPYIKDERTYVPVRYLAYSLGVTEEAVTWDKQSRKVGIYKDGIDISLIIGSPIMQVNKKPVKMDVAPEITSNRTFLPARWVAEALGAEVDWDNTSKHAIIKMPLKEPGN